MEKWQTPETIAFWLLIVCIVVFTLAFLIVRLFRMRYRQHVETELSMIRSEISFREQLLDVQEKERVRFGADLHDNLIGKLMILQLRHQLSDQKEDFSATLSEIIAEGRRISHDLSPPMIEHVLPEQLLANALKAVETRFVTHLDYDVRAETDLSPQWKTHFLRIIQELITNSLKHSDATELRARIRITQESISLNLSDDGKGFAGSVLSEGIGMQTIALRSRELKSSYKFTSRQGKGLTFLLHHKFEKS